MIEGSVFINPPTARATPGFTLTCNRPWNLLAVYITVQGIKGTESVTFGRYLIGGRTFASKVVGIPSTNDIKLASNVKDFPIFAADMTAPSQSVIAIPSGVQFTLNATLITGDPTCIVTFKVLIQKPADDGFNYTVVWGT